MIFSGFTRSHTDTKGPALRSVLFAYISDFYTVRKEHGAAKTRTEVVAIGTVQIGVGLWIRARENDIDHNRSARPMRQRGRHIISRSVVFAELVPKPVHRDFRNRTAGNQENLVGDVSAISKGSYVAICARVKFEDNIIADVDTFRLCGLMNCPLGGDFFVWRERDVLHIDLLAPASIENNMINNLRYHN